MKNLEDLEKKINGEFYVAPVYNELIGLKKRIGMPMNPLKQRIGIPYKF